MVGLGAIAEFTHGIEAVLERIRAGLLAVDSDIITTLLEARDHLAAMVEAEAARSPIPPSGELTQRLVSLLRGPRTAGPPSAAATPDRRRPAAGPLHRRRRRRTRHRRLPPPADPRRSPSRNRRAARSPVRKTPKPRRSRALRAARRKRWSHLPIDRPAARRDRDRGERRAGAEDLSGHADARPRRVAARDQPARRPRRAARSGRDVDRHRPGPGAPARPARPGTVLPVAGRSRSRPKPTRSGSAKRSFSSPKTARRRSSG